MYCNLYRISERIRKVKKVLIQQISQEKGVAIIIAIAVVATLAIVGVMFATDMRLEQKAAGNYRDALKARYIAEMGIEEAIAQIRNAAAQYAYEDMGRWNLVDDAFAISGDGTVGNRTYTYDVTIIDCARQIYVNDGEKTEDGGSLDKMLVALDITGVADGTADSIIEYRNGLDDAIYLTKEQVRLAPNMSKEKYTTNGLKNYITVHGYVDSNTVDDTGTSDPRAPICINTASRNVLIAVLEPLNGITLTEAEDVAGHIINENYRPIRTWAEFNICIDDAVSHGHLSSSNDATTIKDNCNPNCIKPGTYTTEFCFHSGGYYEIESTGKIGWDNTPSDGYYLADSEDVVCAERKILTIVKIFDIWNQTTDSQFQISKDGGAARGLDISTPGAVYVPTDYDDTCDPATWPEKWTVGAGSPSPVGSPSYDASGSIMLEPNEEVHIDFSGELQERLMMTSCWVYSVSPGVTDDGVTITLGEDATEAIDIKFAFNGGNYPVQVDQGMGYESTSVTWDESNWYEVQVVADVLADTYDLYVSEFPGVAVSDSTSPASSDITFKGGVIDYLNRLTVKNLTATADCYVDDVRFLLSGPIYSVDANCCTVDSTDFKQWGTVAWTETDPADPDDRVLLQLRSPGDTWKDHDGNSAATYGTKPLRINLTSGNFCKNSAGEVISKAVYTASTLYYCATLASCDAGLTTPPALNDVTITYLLPVKILYWREVTE